MRKALAGFRATLALAAISVAGTTLAEDAAALRLVPFPKEVTLQAGAFALNRELVLEVPEDQMELISRALGEELRRAGCPEPKQQKHQESWMRLSAKGGDLPTLPPEKLKPEAYGLWVSGDSALAFAASPAGLFYAAQTLCQLIRANRRENGIPCLIIRDWPALKWRCHQDDLTRGASSSLDTLKNEVALGAALKLNMFTYYMEYQFAFEKHPKIGPKDGSLTPTELRTLVEFAKPLHMQILGNQQSFGHFERILQHPEYAAMRENGSVLSPVKEETYKLLDDLYSEVIPLLPLDMFNVCCDETWGLGEGPSKELAKQIGVGGVYTKHIRRVHDLLKEKYHKRMMMWGDIILQHPDKLGEIPKDTVMLTWAYDPRASFENQILPFTKSGYEFFVCPGISNWSRILPDFNCTVTNIRNFVRDGVKNGAIGMLNTAWEDDGEALKGYNWHGYAWGAECAWTGSTTTPEDFNRRIGAVLFGEKGDHFGQAIELLAQTHALHGMEGMNNSRFWREDFSPRQSPAATRTAAERLLKLVQPALEHLAACKKEATVNAALLDSVILGAKRMELIGKRMLDGLETAQDYCKAAEAKDAALIKKAEERVKACREAHETLGNEFKRIWLAESKPYALDWTMKRYAAAVTRYEKLAQRLAQARQDLEAGKPIPSPEELGLSIPDGAGRRTRASKIETTPIASDAPWAEPAASHRIGLRISAGSVDRCDLPVEVDVPLPEELAGRAIRAVVPTSLPAGTEAGATPREIPAQLDPALTPGRTRLTLIIPGPLAKNTQATLHVYLGLKDPTKPLPTAVTTSDAPNGMKWIENNQIKLLLGPEGAHIYRWEVKALQNRDLTMPGESGWSGFSDMHSHRGVPHTIKCIARGPALVRYACNAESGLIKTVSLFAGVSWAEVVLNEPTGHYWDFDDPKNFAADGPTPGKYLFSTGASGAVGKQADGVSAQVKVGGAHWCVKYGADKLALGLLTPETAANHVFAPGAGAGGVGIENSPLAAHFVTFGGTLSAEPAEAMNYLCKTLDLRNQPEVFLGTIESRQSTR
ncbi:MAG TPA: beta-N-acetylhexosaminidase [Planctomycetota bacterium]|jgi:hypothetical protein